MLTDDGKHLYVSWDEYHLLIERLALKVAHTGWQFDQILCLARGGMRPGDVLSRVFDKPLDADDILACEPIYERFAGWSEPTVGLTQWDQLPLNARRYLERVQQCMDAPIDMVSTGPDREQTIVLRHPYKN